MNDGREDPEASSQSTHDVPAGDGYLSASVTSHPDATSRQIVYGKSRVERITDHGKGLVSDVTAWVELKMKLVQVEIEERVEDRLNHLAAKAIVAGLGILGGVFLLVALSLGCGAILIALGLSAPLSYFLGFLLISLLLVAAARIVRSMQPHLLDVGKKERKVDEQKLIADIPPQDNLALKRHGKDPESAGTRRAALGQG